MRARRPGLLGDSFLMLLELAKRNVLLPGAAVVPQAATLYCCAVEVLPTAAGGFDFATLDKFRHEAPVFQGYWVSGLMDFRANGSLGLKGFVEMYLEQAALWIPKFKTLNQTLL